MRPPRYADLGVLATVAALAPLAAAAPARPAPDIDVLRSLVLRPPKAATDANAAAPLLKRLRAEVEGFLDRGPFAPLLVDVGKPSPKIEFADPADTLYALSIALPHLPPPTAERLKAYLARLVKDRNPLATRAIGLADGTRRELAPLGEHMRMLLDAPWRGGLGPMTLREPAGRLYAVWAYCHHAGNAEFARANWSAIAAASERAGKDAAGENAKIASLIGYARLCRMVGEPHAEGAVAAAVAALGARVAWERANQPTDDPASWFFERGGVFIRSSWGRGGRIPRWDDLTPEIGRLLARYCREETARLDRFVDTAVPMAWATQTLATYTRMENSGQWPRDARAVFLVKALALDYTPEQVRRFVSAPWCRADPWYVEKLVHAIRAFDGDRRR